jgi:hypothetical protein
MRDVAAYEIRGHESAERNALIRACDELAKLSMELLVLAEDFSELLKPVSGRCMTTSCCCEEKESIGELTSTAAAKSVPRRSCASQSRLSRSYARR